MMQEEQLRFRIHPGDIAFKIAKEEAGSEKLTKVHLESAIVKLLEAVKIAPPTPIVSGETDWLRSQLQHMNELMITLRYMILALSADSDEEIQATLRQLNSQINTKQQNNAQKTNLDEPQISAVMSKLEELHNRDDDLKEAHKSQEREAER